MKTTDYRVIFNESDRDYVIVNANDVQTMYLHDTYDQFGIKSDEYAANDYSLLNPECDMLDQAKEEGAKIFGEQFYDIEVESSDEGIIAYNLDDFDALEGKGTEINNFLRNYENEHAIYNDVTGITFWNGSSYETVVIFEEDYVSKDVEEEILKAFEDADFQPAAAAGFYEAESEDFHFVKKAYPSYYVARANKI